VTLGRVLASAFLSSTIQKCVDAPCVTSKSEAQDDMLLVHGELTGSMMPACKNAFDSFVDDIKVHLWVTSKTLTYRSSVSGIGTMLQ